MRIFGTLFEFKPGTRAEISVNSIVTFTNYDFESFALNQFFLSTKYFIN